MTDPRCGRAYGYAVHVRDQTEKCAPCLRAHADHQANYMRRRYLNRGPLLVDSTGTHRRLKALAAMGWSARHIGERFGVSGAAVRQWRARPTLQRDTVAKVAELYDELWDQRGPSEQAIRNARAKGWPPPLAWDDDEIDNPDARPMHDLRGDTTGRPRDTDLEERILELTRAGLSAAEIAVQLRTYKRHVQRVRARYREDVA